MDLLCPRPSPRSLLTTHPFNAVDAPRRSERLQKPLRMAGEIGAGRQAQPPTASRRVSLSAGWAVRPDPVSRLISVVERRNSRSQSEKSATYDAQTALETTQRAKSRFLEHSPLPTYQRPAKSHRRVEFWPICSTRPTCAPEPCLPAYE